MVGVEFLIRFGSALVICSVSFCFVVDAFYIFLRDGKEKDNLLQCNNGLISPAPRGGKHTKTARLS